MYIRPVETEDAQALTRLWNKIQDEDDFLANTDRITQKKQKERILESLKSFKEKKSVQLVAVLNGKIVGSTGCHIGKGRLSHLAEGGIFIDSEYRGLGIGTALTTELFKILRSWKIKVFVAQVMETNKGSIALVKKVGMKEFGVLPKGIQRKGKLIKLHYFYKEII